MARTRREARKEARIHEHAWRTYEHGQAEAQGEAHGEGGEEGGEQEAADEVAEADEAELETMLWNIHARSAALAAGEPMAARQENEVPSSQEPFTALSTYPLAQARPFTAPSHPLDTCDGDCDCPE